MVAFLSASLFSLILSVHNISVALRFLSISYSSQKPDSEFVRPDAKLSPLRLTTA